MRIDDGIERSEFMARVEQTGFPVYLDQSKETSPTYGLLYVAAMLSINIEIAHPSGVLDLVLASTHDEYQFIRVKKTDEGDDFVVRRDERDDEVLGRTYMMPVISTRHISQDVFSSKFSMRRVIGGRVVTSNGMLHGHRFKLRVYRSSGITSGPHLMRIAKKRSERNEVRNLFAPLPPGQNTAINAAKITAIGAARPFDQRVPLSTVPKEKLGAQLRPIPVLTEVYVLCAPTAQEAAEKSFPQFALKRHFVRWLFSNPVGQFECCVRLFAGLEYYSIQVNVLVTNRSVSGYKLYYLRHTNVASDLRPTTTLEYPSLAVQNHHLGGRAWWTVGGQRFHVAGDLLGLVHRANAKIAAAIDQFSQERRIDGDAPIIWTSRNTRVEGTLPYRELDRHGMTQCSVSLMPEGVESLPHYAQLEGQREDLVGRGLWPQMLRKLMETSKVFEFFQEGYPCPYIM